MDGILAYQKKQSGLENKLQNILLFRSIRPEEMGYVAIDIKGYFSKDTNITVLTNPNNFNEMKSINLIENVITYSGNEFRNYDKYKNEINDFKNIKYDLIIIPTNGNIDSYENVFNFAKKNFSFKKIYFYKYKSNFILAKNNFLGKTIKKIILFFSSLIIAPLTLFYIIVMLLVTKIKDS